MEKPILLQPPKQQTQAQPPTTPNPNVTQVQVQPSKHPLFDLTNIEAEVDEIDGRTQRCYAVWKQLIASKTQNDSQELYQSHIALNPQSHMEELTMGLLVAILLEPDGCQDEFYKDVVSMSKDSLTMFGGFLNMIIVERVTRVSQHSLKQIFWLTNKLIKDGIQAAENTCSNLIRQTAKGDLSARNLFMVENLLDLLTQHREWLINSTTFLAPTVIYNFTRLIIDHLPVAHNVIRQKEIDFVIGLIRERFDFVLSIGKDFLRLLNGLQRVGGFHQLFQDMYVNDPKELHPNYEGVKQLFAQRTPRRLFQSCLTFDMERKISYLATQVKFGNQKKWQDTFHKLYLTGPESSWLRSDLIRYICTIIHPSNEVLCSEIIPRWAIIGWLLTTVNHVVIQCGPALFFDWFSYDPKSDNIMNIEPAILVMYYSLRSHPQVTSFLLDYLCRAPSGFHWKLQDLVKTGIKRSLQQVLEKRVLPSLAPLFVNPKYDVSLKTRIKENFPEFCQIDNNGIAQSNSEPAQPVAKPLSAPKTSGQITAASVAITTLNEVNEAESLKHQGDIIIVEESPVTDPSQTPTKEQTKTNPDNATSTSIPSLGYQPPTKIHVSTAYSATKLVTPNISDQQPPISTNRNGVDVSKTQPTVINSTATPSIGPKIKPAPSVATTAKKVSKTSVINLEASIDDSSDANTRTNDTVADHDRVMPSNDVPIVFNEISSDLLAITTDDCQSAEIDNPGRNIRVIYPFMTVKKTYTTESIDSLGNEFNQILPHLGKDNNPQDRIDQARKLRQLLSKSASISQSQINDLGCYIATCIANDFTERIHPALREDMTCEKCHEISPLFVLAQSIIDEDKPNQMRFKLLASICEHFKAARFLLLYYMRICQILANTSMYDIGVAKLYHMLCVASSPSTDCTECLVSDMKMMATYDQDMFCFMLSLIFADLAHSDNFSVINNCELVRLVTANIDPLSLQEFLCLCLTGSMKIISREAPISIIENSLTWESCEQYFFWKILTAQSVPIENYIQILPDLDVKKHPEAMSSILLNLQKISQPDVNILQTVIDSHCRHNDQFVAAIIRYWSIRNDLKEMTKNIISISFGSRPPSPQVKRKGQAKTSPTKGGSTSSASSTTSSSSSSNGLSTRGEKVLLILDSIRRRAPRNKLLAQTELLDTLSHYEPLCNEALKSKLSLLLQSRQKPTKKKKVDNKN